MTSYYMGVVSGLLILGVLMIWQPFGKHHHSMRWKVRPSKHISDAVLALRDTRGDDIFLRAGVPISMAKYTAIRNLCMIGLLLLTLLSLLQDGVVAARMPILIAVVFFLLTLPVSHFGKHRLRTPFQCMLDALTQHQREQMDDELYKLITQLKNLITTQRDHAWSADYYFATLLRASHYCKPVFAQSLSKMRLGDTGAFAYFADTVGTKLGQEFASVLQKLDVLEPQELLAQITAFQSAKREERRTRQLQRQERTGQRLFMLASVLFFVIIVDFMYIVFANLMQAMIF